MRTIANRPFLGVFAGAPSDVALFLNSNLDRGKPVPEWEPSQKGCFSNGQEHHQ